jgi:hypothetical protein
MDETRIAHTSKHSWAPVQPSSTNSGADVCRRDAANGLEVVSSVARAGVRAGARRTVNPAMNTLDG